jgi:hypothetical protein
MSSFLKKIAPLALMAIPGIGTAVGSALLGAGAAGASTLGSALVGAAGGALSGGGLKGALIGGATGGLGANLGGIGQQTLGLSGTQSAALGGALQGAGAGAATGEGLKGALIGAGLGGAGGYALSGGLPETLGTPSGVGPYGPMSGSGAVGTLTRNIPSLGMNTPGIVPQQKETIGGVLAQSGTGGGMFSMKNIGTIASNLQQYNQQDKLKEELLKAQQRAEAGFAPYNEAGKAGLSNLMRGFDPGDITQNTGYQFRLGEGQKALERSLAARGMSQSGAALKAAQEYGQNLAAEEYDNAYRRWYAENSGLANSGQTAARDLAPVYENMGDAANNARVAKSNLVSKTLSQVLGGTGNLVEIGVDRNGRKIYQDESTGEISYGA